MDSTESDKVADAWMVFGPNGDPVVDYPVRWADASRMLLEAAGRNHVVHQGLGLPVSLAMLRMLPGRPVSLRHPTCRCGQLMDLTTKGHTCYWACPSYVTLGCRTRQFNPEVDLDCV